jgi:hypothetical protein
VGFLHRFCADGRIHQSMSNGKKTSTASSSCWERLFKSRSQRQSEYTLVEQKDKERELKESVDELSNVLEESQGAFVRAQTKVTRAKRVALFHNANGNEEEASAWAFIWRLARLDVEKTRKEIQETERARELVLKSERVKRIIKAKAKAGKYVKGLTTDKQVEEHDDAREALDEATVIVDEMAGTSDVVLHEEKDKTTRSQDEAILNRLVVMNVRQKKGTILNSTRDHIQDTSTSRAGQVKEEEEEEVEKEHRVKERERVAVIIDMPESKIRTVTRVNKARVSESLLNA